MPGPSRLMKTSPLQILLVEDSAGDALLLREMFRREKPGSFALKHVVRMSEAEAYLAQAGVDIILLDMGLPDEHGIETVRRMHAVAPNIPVIVLTGLDDEVLAAEAMKEGAQDFLIKGQIESRALPRALRHAIERQHMQTETELARIDQIRIKDEFLSHVSHELRSPLNAIYQFVTLVQDGLAGEVNPEQRGDLEIVLRNVKQLKSMINDLLEVTRSESGKVRLELQPTSLSDAIAETVDTLQWAATEKGITLSSERDRHLPLVVADPTRMRQILIILVENAIKFTPANGTVRIQAGLLELDPGVVLIQVSDTGCGIDPDMIERIFERLFQAPIPSFAARKGLGLGLYICKDLVTRQGGRIWATSTPGKGAVFSLTVPIFSLFNLIAPVLRKGQFVDGPVALVVTEIRSQSGWLSDQVRAELSHEVRNVLQQCLRSDRSVFLTMSLAGDVELFFVLAATDDMAAAALTQRIGERLEGRDHVRQAGLMQATSYRFLKTAKGGIQPSPSEAMETYLKAMAVEIQELLNEEISRRLSPVPHTPPEST
jgi:signal transduction histidine kinase